MKAILGQKLGMTQIFDDEARAIPVSANMSAVLRIRPSLLGRNPNLRFKDHPAVHNGTYGRP